MNEATIIHQMNLGNSYIKAEQWGKALQIFRKLEKHLPRDPNIQQNIGWIKSQRIDQFKEPSNILNIFIQYTHLLNLLEWLTLLLILVTTVNLLMFLFHQAKKRNHKQLHQLKKGLWGVSIGCIVTITIIIFHIITTPKLGIITVQRTALLPTPSSSFEPSLYLHDGTEFKLLKQGHMWTQIKLPNGLTGWIKPENYQKL